MCNKITKMRQHRPFVNQDTRKERRNLVRAERRMKCNTYLTPSSFSEIHHPEGSGPRSKSHLFANNNSGTLGLLWDFLAVDFLAADFLAADLGPLGFFLRIRADSYASPSRPLRCLHVRALSGTPPYRCKRKQNVNGTLWSVGNKGRPVLDVSRP